MTFQLIDLEGALDFERLDILNQSPGLFLTSFIKVADTNNRRAGVISERSSHEAYKINAECN